MLLMYLHHPLNCSWNQPVQSIQGNNRSLWWSKTSKQTSINYTTERLTTAPHRPTVTLYFFYEGTAEYSISSACMVFVLTFFFILPVSSLYPASCFFHSSTLAVDSCKAAVSLALLFFNVCNSISHFLALDELEW